MAPLGQGETWRKRCLFGRRFRSLGAFDERAEDAFEGERGHAEALGNFQEKLLFGVVVFIVGHGDEATGSDDDFGSFDVEVATHSGEDVGQGFAGLLHLGDFGTEGFFAERVTGEAEVDLVDDLDLLVLDVAVGEKHGGHDFSCSAVGMSFEIGGVFLRVEIEDVGVIGALAAQALHELAHFVEWDERQIAEREESADAAVSVFLSGTAFGAVELTL